MLYPLSYGGPATSVCRNLVKGRKAMYQRARGAHSSLIFVHEYRKYLNALSLLGREGLVRELIRQRAQGGVWHSFAM